MGLEAENGSLAKIVPPLEQIDMKVNKYLRGEAANLEAVLHEKKLKGQLAVREELYGKSAKAAAKAEKGGYLEAEGIEETWRIRQEAIAGQVDISSSRNQFDITLPDLGPYTNRFYLKWSSYDFWGKERPPGHGRYEKYGSN